MADDAYNVEKNSQEKGCGEEAEKPGTSVSCFFNFKSSQLLR